jgi:hypothetical protein
VASWTDPAEDQPRISAARRYAGAVEPFSSGVYVNALTDEGQVGVQRAYGAGKLARLTALKDRYDPATSSTSTTTSALKRMSQPRARRTGAVTQPHLRPWATVLTAATTCTELD